MSSIPSNPASFSYQSGAGADQAVTFNEGPGSWSQAWWTANGTASNLGTIAGISIVTASDTVTLVNHAGTTWSCQNVPLSALQLSDLNAAGGMLGATMTGSSNNLGFTVNVSSLVLVLPGWGFGSEGSGGGGVRGALPGVDRYVPGVGVRGG